MPIRTLRSPLSSAITRGDRLDELVTYFGQQALRRLDVMAPLAATDTWDGAAAVADDTRLGRPLLPAFN